MKTTLKIIMSLILSFAVCYAASALLMCAGAFVYWDSSIIDFNPANWGEWSRLIFLAMWLTLCLISFEPLLAKEGE